MENFRKELEDRAAHIPCWPLLHGDVVSAIEMLRGVAHRQRVFEFLVLMGGAGGGEGAE